MFPVHIAGFFAVCLVGYVALFVHLIFQIPITTIIHKNQTYRLGPGEIGELDKNIGTVKCSVISNGNPYTLGNEKLTTDETFGMSGGYTISNLVEHLGRGGIYVTCY